MDYLLPAIAALVAILLLSRPLRENRAWRATVTPLASIIGSGFLVVAPILGHLLGVYALAGMLLIVALAIAVGGVIRFNIRHAESRLEQGGMPPAGVWLERAANLSLSLAYVVSVAFYLRLLSAFALRPLGLDHAPWPDILTTLILAFIGLAGWLRGLHVLENLEEYSVSIKLAVIAALLVGLGWHDIGAGFDLSGVAPLHHDAWDTLRTLGGLLLVVQGFETSRYLGEEYDARLRVDTMLRAQWLSGIIYVVFVLLVTPLLGMTESGRVDETAVIDLASAAARVLGPMLVLAAIMSQFSAAVADTVGAGGLVQEETRRRIDERRAYPLVAVLAIVLVWSADLFEIISLASRAFAFYYLLQTLQALRLTGEVTVCRRRTLCRLRFGLVAALLTFVVIFGKAVG
jgi:hypothetical protein